jgi:hypothetical protein
MSVGGRGYGVGSAMGSSHSPALQLLPVLGDAAQPAPAGQAAAGGVEHVEAIAVSDARHLAKQAAAAEEAGGDVARPGEAAQVGLVECEESQSEGCGRGRGDPVVGDAEVVSDGVLHRLGLGFIFCSGRR